MKEFLFTCMFCCCGVSIIAQKKLIDNDTYKTWVALRNYNISNDGKYAWYEYGSEKTKNMLVICTTDGKYKEEFSDGGNAVFTEDSRHLILSTSEGMGIFHTGANAIQYIKDGRGFVVPENGNGRWLAYNLHEDIILKDLISGREKCYSGATEARFNTQGNVLLILTDTSLLWVSLPSCNEKVILHDSPPSNITFDDTGTRLAFFTPYEQGYSLRYYQSGMDSATCLVTNHASDLGPRLTIANETLRFSTDGEHIFFKLAEDKILPIIQPDSTVITPKVNIWNYRDEYLQAQQLENISRLSYRTYAAVTSTTTGSIIQLESMDTALVLTTGGNRGSRYVLIRNIINNNESYWNKDDVTSYLLKSTRDGSHKTVIPHSSTFSPPPDLSPSEHFVIWYDSALKNYFSYEISTGITRNITQAINVAWYNDEHHALVALGYNFGIAGWLIDDSALLIYDRYDIWLIDPFGRKTPQNITAGYGKSHNIIFRIIATKNSFNPIHSTDTLLLAAFDRNNKYNGFWKIQLQKKSSPVLGNMEPYLFYFPRIFIAPSLPPPIRAKNAPVYLVQRMSATQAPNLLATRDFKSFIILSNIQPQKDYNWVTTELHHWKMPDGRIADGILYKPENFDPGKKYPIIFHYYEKRSHELYMFRKPGLSKEELNIPWYVSNGYLIFIPDIYYLPGHTGQGAVDAVVSAAKYISTFPWVDANKMGLQGHSFGGYETNYLITHTTLFAAAQEGAGPSDMISHYGGLGFGEQSFAFFYETSQINLRATPWDRPDLYVENSPIFKVDKVNTPLLIMHNKDDGAVPFTQAVELFTALRRLKKPVWMLQYDGQGHSLTDPDCILDFTIRTQQFFGHYLKNEPPPTWMTGGIPAKFKGLRSGLEQDSTRGKIDAGY